jgi:hypothetical protein
VDSLAIGANGLFQGKQLIFCNPRGGTHQGVASLEVRFPVSEALQNSEVKDATMRGSAIESKGEASAPRRGLQGGAPSRKVGYDSALLGECLLFLVRSFPEVPGCKPLGSGLVNGDLEVIPKGHAGPRGSRAHHVEISDGFLEAILSHQPPAEGSSLLVALFLGEGGQGWSEKQVAEGMWRSTLQRGSEDLLPLRGGRPG